LREPSREFVYEVDRSQAPPVVKTWAVCVETDDEELLIPGKLYQIQIGRRKRVLVYDEDDEAVLAPIKFFMPVSLPAEVMERLSELKKAA
jgi:hypothetical protein